jgi:hypothetical protein
VLTGLTVSSILVMLVMLSSGNGTRCCPLPDFFLAVVMEAIYYLCVCADSPRATETNVLLICWHVISGKLQQRLQLLLACE